MRQWERKIYWPIIFAWNIGLMMDERRERKPRIRGQKNLGAWKCLQKLFSILYISIIWRRLHFQEPHKAKYEWEKGVRIERQGPKATCGIPKQSIDWLWDITYQNLGTGDIDFLFEKISCMVTHQWFKFKAVLSCMDLWSDSLAESRSIVYNSVEGHRRGLSGVLAIHCFLRDYHWAAVDSLIVFAVWVMMT